MTGYGGATFSPGVSNGPYMMPEGMSPGQNMSEGFENGLIQSTLGDDRYQNAYMQQ